ncbi:hypothetical protein COLO4_30542 [Corchorus olitorius]|uniref:Protein kinase domain-containing protein n=1 Tax=Corchorus olitorius TaxID=93759 RepID=A0A1R3H802_9ROSI|nr:hypothetical protein COLO4_30542 [Corchorus olitorius]
MVGGFISIDCGVDVDYHNSQTDIYYKSDKDFIDTGKNRDVIPKYGGHVWREYNNLRSFPEGKRNCYTLKPEQGKNNYYFIRASFLYGNYDGKDQVPEFDLYMGVNYWTTVRLSSVSQMLLHDLVYFFSADTDYLCLVNTGSGIPFISALELRPSDNSLFNTTNHIALNHWAKDLTAAIDSYRYKDDAYDNIWLSYNIPDSVAINTSLDIDTRASTYGLPVGVLTTASRSLNVSYSLRFSFSYNSAASTSQYFTVIHFAEIAEDARNKLTQFNISFNDIENTKQTVTLEYLKALSLRFQNLTTDGDFSLTLVATPESDLPPILNALDIYQVLQFPNSPTHQSDVAAIMAIKRLYNVNKVDWQGDPCLPKEHTWIGIGCSFNTTPRIISLNMSGSNLTGEIPSSFSDLKALEFLDLSNNELSGQVPEVLGQLPNLKVLNLSGNKFTGSIPQSLKNKSNNGSLVLSFTDHPDLCQMDSCRHKGKRLTVPVLASIATSAFVLILSILLIVYCMIRRRRKEEPLTRSRVGSFKSKNRPFTYSQIVRITGNFTTIVGEGGFGKVYLGTLTDNTPVAVKLLSQSSNQGCKEFRSEAQLLTIVHHRNLLSLIGYCDEKGNMALIYEYMENGNLRQHLSGLEYLHNGCKPPIVHRDLKSSNILLTENKQAKISDFGLSRIFTTETATHISTRPAGTFGYLDPEYHVSGKLNKKSDVYSFGMILFELITGQPAVIRFQEERIHILEWMRPKVEEADIGSIVDPRLQGEFDVNAAWKFVEIAMSCAQSASTERPDMNFVLTELKECMAIEMAHGRTQRMQSDMATSGNPLQMSVLNMDDSDMVPMPR